MVWSAVSLSVEFLQLQHQLQLTRFLCRTCSVGWVVVYCAIIVGECSGELCNFRNVLFFWVGRGFKSHSSRSFRTSTTRPCLALYFPLFLLHFLNAIRNWSSTYHAPRSSVHFGSNLSFLNCFQPLRLIGENGLNQRPNQLSYRI